MSMRDNDELRQRIRELEGLNEELASDVARLHDRLNAERCDAAKRESELEAFALECLGSVQQLQERTRLRLKAERMGIEVRE